MSTAGPLSGYRVVDLTAMISGPYATQLLGDQGADVIKVEPLSGDLMRLAAPSRGGISAPFLLSNRSKRSLAVNLKDSEGKRILARLVETADVFVHNFRPGAVARVGLDEDVVRAFRPDIVYVSISGFGEAGPYRDKRVYDPVIQALSGLMHHQGRGGRPSPVRTILPDKLTAVLAAQAITAALLARERGGRGEHVRLSMLDATVAWLWPDAMMTRSLIGDGASPPPGAQGGDTLYETEDGFLVVFIVSDDEWRGFLRAAERLDLAQDPRFTTMRDRLERSGEIAAVIRDALRSGRTADWLAKLEAEQVPCARVNTLEDLFTDPQVAANELIRESEHPAAGRLREPRPAARFESNPLVLDRHAPRLGEHTDEILAELEIHDVDRLRSLGVVA
ncbi:MAG: CoA transferase [Pseudomonadales bacterium]